MNKKSGFSIIELVIVIAVIAVLAAILVPVFVNIVDDAARTEAVQNARNACIAHLEEDVQDGSDLPDMIYIQQEDRVVIIDNGSVDKDHVYSSKDAALIALCDNPSNYKLVATEDAKLFIVVKK